MNMQQNPMMMAMMNMNPMQKNAMMMAMNNMQQNQGANNQMMQMNPIKQQQQVFDPSKINQTMKRTLTNQTITQSKIGCYQKFPKFKPVVLQTTKNFVPIVPSNICEVQVVYEHILDVAEKYAEKGITYATPNHMNPVVLNVVGRDFSGSNLETNEEIRDEIINIRTTFNNCLGSRCPFPITEEQNVYSKVVTVIRPTIPYMFLPPPQTYRVSMITTAPIKTEKLLTDENKMELSDYLKTCSIIEGVFQTAIAGSHSILILPPFGHEEDNNPVDDIIKIYNFCIYKYSHYFKKIIIGVPPHYPKSVFADYQKEIVKPNELVLEIDNKQEADELQRKLLSKGAKNEKVSKKNKKNKKTQLESNKYAEQSQNPQNFNSEQMKMFAEFMNMMNNKK